MSIFEALRTGEKKLLSSGIENARLEALWILAAHLKMLQNPQELILQRNRDLPLQVVRAYEKDIARRMKKEPLAYLLRVQEFYGINFRVNRNVLIPRQETEILVEEAIQIVKDFPAPQILDIGTGCGNIAISIAKHCPDAKIVATDISQRALEIAKLNASLQGVEERIIFVRADLFCPQGSQRLPVYDFDLIVSNPPYVKKRDIKKLQKEIQREPALALDGGEDGLKFILRILTQAKKYLQKNGFLILEIGYDQFNSVKKRMLDAGFSSVRSVKDISGIERVIIGKN